MAADYVDIGNPTSEATHNPVSWGPIEPNTNPGSWGGIGSWPGTCRVIWSSADQSPLGAGSRSAEVDMYFSGGPEVISFEHLEGPADDSFDVYVEAVNVKSYPDSGNPGESWYVDGFTHNPGPAGFYTVAFVATGTQWSSWGTFGQVAFSGVWISSGPVSDEKSTWGNVKSLYR